MIIAITGSKGFIGQSLIRELEKRAYEYLPIPHEIIIKNDKSLFEIISKADVIVNLAGSSIQKRWTRANKFAIYQSRVDTTRKLVKAIASLSSRPKKIISASAIGIYDENNIHDEHSRYLSYDFLGKVVRDWESAALFAKNFGLEIYIYRLGIVLGHSGGIIKKLYPLFNLGLGSTIGNGKQAMSFIHIDDLINIFIDSIEGKLPENIYNAVSPKYTTNKEFSKVFAKALKKPLIFSIPKYALNVLYGQGANVLYKGQKVLPAHLLEQNFIFKFPSIEDAINDIVSKFRS